MPDPVTDLNKALEGRYRIERSLGEGGMATVFLADDKKHERKVAVKVLKPELTAVIGADRFVMLRAADDVAWELILVQGFREELKRLGTIGNP
jgi:serine/threonine protein kinase